MQVLILGGTRFVGRHIADALVQRGHGVTLFNRGTNASAHADLEQVHGDRAADLARLGGRSWDAVIDTSGYTPDVVETSARFFQRRAARYVFISSISVYDLDKTQHLDENAPLLALPDEADPSTYSDEHYGALKALCERVVCNVFAERATIVRPGLVAGPHDPTDRFTYWPVRFDEGGRVLVPPTRTPLQYVDARDLAEFAAIAIEREISGAFNCVTEPEACRFADLYAACTHEASAEDAQAIEVSEHFIAEHDIRPWADFPLWLPSEGPFSRMVKAQNARAVDAGLRTKPLAETVRETLAWARAAGKHRAALCAGLAPERETELLRELQNVTA